MSRLHLLAFCALMLIFASGCAWLTTSLELASKPPRMTCATPTPKPTIQVPDGDETVLVAGTPVVRARERDTAPYEIEYGLPLKTPTPYAVEGATFALGTIVNLGASVDAVLTVAPLDVTTVQGTQSMRLFRVSMEWQNPGAPFTFAPARQLVITQVQDASGRIRSGAWAWSPESDALSDLPATATFADTATSIPTGRSTLETDILAPDGTAMVAELRLDGALSDGSGGVLNDMRVQFVNSPPDPLCRGNGLFAPDLSDVNRQAAQPVQAGGSADAVVQAALNQLGRQYCWGGKGFAPCSGCSADAGCVTPACASLPCFDCSGLTWHAYRVNGISIGQGTSNQKNYPSVSRDQVQPGDLLLFTGGPAGSTGFSGIRHVGIYAGNGVMVHAANYPAGVVTVPNVFSNSYWSPRLAVITRPPR